MYHLRNIELKLIIQLAQKPVSMPYQISSFTDSLKFALQNEMIEIVRVDDAYCLFQQIRQVHSGQMS